MIELEKKFEEKYEIKKHDALQEYITFCMCNNTKRVKYKTAEHHILPKSDFPEYKDFATHKWNKSILRHEDHYIAHYLLAKAIKSKEMSYAFYAMNNQETKLRNFDKILEHSSEYQIIMEEALQYMSDINKNKVMAIDKNTNKTIRITSEEYSNNKDKYYTHSTNKITVTDISGKRIRINTFDYDPSKHHIHTKNKKYMIDINTLQGKIFDVNDNIPKNYVHMNSKVFTDNGEYKYIRDIHKDEKITRDEFCVVYDRKTLEKKYIKQTKFDNNIHIKKALNVYDKSFKLITIDADEFESSKHYKTNTLIKVFNKVTLQKIRKLPKDIDKNDIILIKGKILVFRDGDIIQIEKQELKKTDIKNFIKTDINGNKCLFNDKNIGRRKYTKSSNYGAHTKGMVSARNTITNENVIITKEEFYSNDIYVGINQGKKIKKTKISTIGLKNGMTKIVKLYDSNDNILGEFITINKLREYLNKNYQNFPTKKIIRDKKIFSPDKGTFSYKYMKNNNQLRYIGWCIETINPKEYHDKK